MHPQQAHAAHILPIGASSYVKYPSQKPNCRLLTIVDGSGAVQVAPNS
jgi:hypothetical protein